MTWIAAVGRDRMRIIGGLEILGAIALICWPPRVSCRG
jgi:hypothetical protein